MLALWSSGLSLWLWCQHLTLAVVCVPAVLLLIQLPAHNPRKTAGNGSNWGHCHVSGKPVWRSYLLTLAWPNPSGGSHLGSVPTYEKTCVSPFSEILSNIYISK